MYILQIADFHITTTSDVEYLKEKINTLKIALKDNISSEAELVCCLLGDFIEKGSREAYPLANDILQYLVNSLSEVVQEDNIALEIIPGNHDLCINEEFDARSFTEFNIFARNHSKKDISFSDEKSVNISEHFGYTFCGINTILREETSFGQINYTNLSDLQLPKNVIVLTHHSLISGDPGDAASIRDGYHLVNFLEKHHAIGLLHGHTHGYKRFTVGNDCQVVGVGPFFKQEEDIANQCNLITVSGESIKQIKTFTYHGDRNIWDSVLTYIKQDDNNYVGNSIYEVYCSIQKEIKEDLLLNNFRLLVRQDYLSFERDITDNFISYKDEAHSWQANEPNEKLEYTHVQLMNSKDKHWADFIIETLKQNSTSKRAIIPLLTKEAAYKGGDSYLVSFDMIQFGFEGNLRENLQVTVYLRALELCHFLPINLYEVYLMSDIIKRAFPSIQNIEVCINAFRAEVKKQYNCYRKCDIDIISESKMCKMLSKGDLSSFKQLLYEKARTKETVIDFIWIDKIGNVTKDYYQDGDSVIILQQIEAIKKLLCDLKEKRKTCSNYAATNMIEDMINAEVIKLADLYK